MSFKNRYNEDGHYDEAAIDSETREPLTPKGKEKKKSASADALAVFALFDNPAKGIWPMRPLERAAAQVLHDTYGLETIAKKLKRIALEREKKDQYFPDANTPSELLDKMPKLDRYFTV